MAEPSLTLEKLTLENRIGTLADLVPQFVDGSWQTSAELMTERRTNERLRAQWFYTANFALYRVEDGDVVLYFGGRENNPVFKNVGEASRQLRENKDYVPSAEDISLAVEPALRVKLSDLQLQIVDGEFSYVQIDTRKYEDMLNAAQRSLAEAVYDAGQDFKVNMKMLADAGIKKTKIYVLTPDYVTQKVKGDVPAVARACWLDLFNSNSNFNASGRYVYGQGAVRGVPRAKREE